MNRRELFKGLFGGALLGLMPRAEAVGERVSCLMGDPGYRPDYWKWRAYVDGIDVSGIVQTADTRLPYVEEMVKENGRFVRDGDKMKTRRRYGVVTVERLA